MKRVRTAVVILVGLMAMAAATASGMQDVPGPSAGHEWPFGNDPRDAFDYVPASGFVATVGSTVLVPGSTVFELETVFRFDPFFTRSQTDVIVLPMFAVNHSLETGLEFSWWSASVDVDLALSPWALVSTGGWLELHPQEWVIFSNPELVLDGDVGWGPQWGPVSGWSHAVGGTLNASATWNIPTAWNTLLEASLASLFDGSLAVNVGVLTAEWKIIATARTDLPFFSNSPAVLRAGVTAQALLLPSFGLGFDLILDFRLNALHAYGLVGASAGGIRAEVGAEIAFDLNLSAELTQAPELE